MDSTNYKNNLILATGSYDHTIRLWSPDQFQIHSIQYSNAEGQSQLEINQGAFIINKIEVSYDKQFLGAAGSFAAFVYDLGQPPLSNKPKCRYGGYKSNVTSIGFKQDNGWIYTGSEDGSIRVHDLAMKDVSKTFSNKDPVNQVILHPNEVELISADQAGNIKIWDLRMNTQECRTSFVVAPEIGVRSISLAMNTQQLCAVDFSGSLNIYKEITLVQKIEKAHSDYILKCQFSPQEKCIATCSADKTIKVWAQNSTQEFELKTTLYGHTKWVWDIAFGCDGQFIMSSSSDGLAKLWKLDDQYEKEDCFTFRGHRKIVNCVALNDIVFSN